ncbi:hypothetical protein FG05_12945 [Fusarium graminearum]|nr:hypothetical protein FG05_12945 [Fusarium graminearum]
MVAVGRRHVTTHNDSSTLTSSRSTTGRYSHGSIGNRPALVVPFDWAYLRSPTSGSREWRHAQMDRAYRGIYSRPRIAYDPATWRRRCGLDYVAQLLANGEMFYIILEDETF